MFWVFFRVFTAMGTFEGLGFGVQSIIFGVCGSEKKFSTFRKKIRCFVFSFVGSKSVYFK